MLRLDLSIIASSRTWQISIETYILLPFYLVVNLPHEFEFYHCVISAIELYCIIVVEVAKSPVISKPNHDFEKLIDMFSRPFEYTKDLGSLLQYRRYSLPSDVFFQLNYIVLM